MPVPRFIRMFVGVPWQGAQTTVGLPKMQYLVISVAYIIGTFKAKANITLGPTVT